MSFLGCGQMDQFGNVNVSSFNGIVPGCGGFIDIAYQTKKLVFCGTFSSGGADWLAYDFSVSDKYFSYASAVIGGECYVVGCLFRESDRDTVATLYNQVISSVRSWDG